MSACAAAACTQLSRPLSKEFSEDRKRAVRLVREQLKHTEVDAAALQQQRNGGAAAAGSNARDGASGVGPDYMGRVVRQLTLEELVYLQEWDNVARQCSTGHGTARPKWCARVCVSAGQGGGESKKLLW
jgi:hypothetical protein